MKRFVRKAVSMMLALAMVIAVAQVKAPTVQAARRVQQLPTIMACSVWSAPATTEANRVKKIPAGYTVTIYTDVIVQSTLGDGKTFYQTAKGCYILCKCFDASQISAQGQTVSNQGTTNQTTEYPKLTDGKVHVATDADFWTTVRNSTIPVIVDFSAVWCGPCQRMKPKFESAAAKYTNVLFLTVDIDDNWRLSSEFGIRAVPTIVIMKNGEVVHYTTGGRDEDGIGSLLKNYAF